MKNRFTFLIFLPTVIIFIIAFWTRGVLFLDPDFGWHIRMGEIIEKTGIPKTDPLSYAMSSYPFVDHEWLTNVILAKLYPTVGIVGLAIFFAFLAMSSLLFRTVISRWAFAPFVLAGTVFMSFTGIRTQVITWLLFSILLVILNNRKVGKWRFTLPFLFIVWANLHGGFGVGIVVLSVATIARLWEQKKMRVSDIILFFLCVLATFCNPYGISLWKELWMQISDPSLRWIISEWQPAFFYPSFAVWIFVSFSVLTVTRHIRKFNLSQSVVYYGLLLAGISSIRHMPLFILAALPMTIKSIEWFSQEVKTYKFGIERLRRAYVIFSIGIVFAGIVEMFVIIERAKTSYSTYPKQAVEFLAKSKSCGQLFSVYDWGGYLAWKLPERRVFIDGRMPSWRWESSPPFESNYAFEEYVKIIRGKIPVRQIIEKYNIDTFLLPVEKKLSIPFLPITLQEILDYLLKKQYEGYDKFVRQLTDGGLVKLYKDKTAVIYKTKHSIQCVNGN